jgi:hypothetical protein
MFGKIWPLGHWAAFGAALGGVYALLQIINQGVVATNGYSYASGRMLGGVLMGALFGAVIAFLRNQLASLGR